MSTIDNKNTTDKKRILIVIACVILIILVIVLMYFYLKKQAVETLPKFIGTATLVSSNTNTVTEEKKEEVPEVKKDEEITIYNSSEEVISLNNTGWHFQETSLKGEYETDGLTYYYNAFTIERDKNLVTKIIFNENYKTDIVRGITVGMELDEVEDVLGKPVFKNNEYNMLGYKTQKLYLCIYEDEIAVYQNEYFTNEKLENMILKYKTREYTGTRNEFSKYIRNTYGDFNFSVDEEGNICLTSYLRGMVIKLAEENNGITVEYYKEYDSSNILTQKMSENVIVKDVYYVEVMEIERNSEK